MTRLVPLTPFAVLVLACGPSSTKPAADPTPPVDDEPAKVSKAPKLCTDIATFDFDAHADKQDDATLPEDMPDDDRDALSAALPQTMPPTVDQGVVLGEYAAAVVSVCDDAGERCTTDLVTARAAGGSFTIAKTKRLVEGDASAPDMLYVDFRHATGAEAPDVLLTSSPHEGEERVMLLSFDQLEPLWQHEVVATGVPGSCDVLIDAWADVTCDGTEEALVSTTCLTQDGNGESMHRQAYGYDPGTGVFVELGKVDISDQM